MKVALCFSGHMRDLNETKVFWTELINKYNIDVYASFWDLENESLGDTIKEFEKVYTPKRLEVESYSAFKQSVQDISSLHIESPIVINKLFQDTSKAFGQLSMYYKVFKANLLSKQLGIEYDLVIRARIDTLLDEKFELILNKALNVPMGTNNCPAFPNSEGLNDCFAYGIPKVMDYYSFIFLQMMEYLKDGHYVFPPEHFLNVHFTKIGIDIRYFPNYMMITRTSKGTAHEMYNGFMREPQELIRKSDIFNFEPDSQFTFKKESIKDEFTL